MRDINIPVLILHSEQDYRCPISQAEELFVMMRLLGKDVTFYRFPGEGHELSRSGSPIHRRQRAEIILDFFAKHLPYPHTRPPVRAPQPTRPSAATHPPEQGCWARFRICGIPARTRTEGRAE